MLEQLANKLKNEFERRFDRVPLLTAAPGRINLIGEHTDYNGGLVFPAAIDKYIVSALAKNKKNTYRVYALDLDEEFEMEFSNLERQERGSWKNYVIGVVSGLLESGAEIKNFDLAFSGDIPIGAGLSSSAALENSIVFGLNELFGLNLTYDEMMQISVQAEHKFAGVECGVMDQFSSLNGSEGHALFLNCADLSFQFVPIELEDYQLVLINTHVKHQLSNSPYNQRKKECEEGLTILREYHPELSSLSNTNLEHLQSSKKEMRQVVYQRCLYVIEENQRVRKARIASENRNWEAFGGLLFASHAGLRDLYEVSCQELDLLVDLAMNHDSVIGSRMVGGGFGGCTLNLIKKGGVDDFISKTKTIYQQAFGITISSYPVNISDGTHLIKL